MKLFQFRIFCSCQITSCICKFSDADVITKLEEIFSIADFLKFIKYYLIFYYDLFFNTITCILSDIQIFVNYLWRLIYVVKWRQYFVVKIGNQIFIYAAEDLAHLREWCITACICIYFHSTVYFNGRWNYKFQCLLYVFNTRCGLTLGHHNRSLNDASVSYSLLL